MGQRASYIVAVCSVDSAEQMSDPVKKTVVTGKCIIAI